MRMRFAFLVLSLALPISLLAQGPVPPEEPVTADQAEVEVDPDADLEAFVDGIVAAYMERDRLAGATVAVVQEGETRLLKGYGIRDGEGNPVDAEETLFRIASISKTFIWTALMQLKEDGLITLEDPVNEHLPESLQLPSGLDGQPIRIHHLMTHTAGFEDSALGHLIEREVEALRPLEEYLAAVRPALVRDPGRLVTYSNYGSALAGALVAHVSGLDFEEYAEERIYAPLGMERSTFREIYAADEVAEGLPAPVSDELAERFSEGFEDRAGLLEARYFEHLIHTSPSGGMSASAGDMARFMKALLNEGEWNGERILEAETARTMSETLARNAEGMNGLAHGFIEYRFDEGLRGYGHGGALVHFFSGMVLVPELDLGIFVATNTQGGRGFTSVLPERIVARKQGAGRERHSASEDFAETGHIYEGRYRNTRRSYTTVEKLGALDSVMQVSVHEDGYLITRLGGESRRWVPMDEGEHLFQRVDGPDRMAFGENGDGDIHYVFHASGINAGERIGFSQTAQWLTIVLGLTGLAALWQLGAIWFRTRAGAHQTRGERWSTWLMLAWSLVWLGFLVLIWQAMNAIGAAGAENLFTWPPTLLTLAVVVANLAVLLSLAALVSLYPVWRAGNWSLRQRVYHLLAVGIGLALVLTLNDWNLIGWRF